MNRSYKPNKKKKSISTYIIGIKSQIGIAAPIKIFEKALKHKPAVK